MSIPHRTPHTPPDFDYEDMARQAHDDLEEVMRERDTLEHRLNDAEDLLRWVIEHGTMLPEAGWTTAEQLGISRAKLRNIRIQCESFLKAGEWVYSRPAQLPACAQDGVEPTCLKCGQPGKSYIIRWDYGGESRDAVYCDRCAAEVRLGILGSVELQP